MDKSGNPKQDLWKEGIWEYDTVYVSLPSWIHDQKKVQQAKKAWERKHAEQQKAVIKNIAQLSKIPLRPVKISYAPEDNEDFSIEDEVPCIKPIGDAGDTVYDLYKNINAPARDLFRGLTNKEIPSLVDDLVLDYLKPSREFRSKIFYEVDDRMLTSLYNVLTYTRDAIEDTLTLIDNMHRGKSNKIRERKGGASKRGHT